MHAFFVLQKCPADCLAQPAASRQTERREDNEISLVCHVMWQVCVTKTSRVTYVI